MRVANSHKMGHRPLLKDLWGFEGVASRGLYTAAADVSNQARLDQSVCVVSGDPDLAAQLGSHTAIAS